MTPDEQRLCDLLNDSCELRSPGDIQNYVETIAALRESNSEDVLRRMLLCLRDTEAGEVQYELVEACEAFPGYVPVFLRVALAIHAKAPRWFRLMLQSILNTPADAEEALDVICEMGPTAKTEFYRIVEHIAADSPQYWPFLEELKARGEER